MDGFFVVEKATIIVPFQFRLRRLPLVKITPLKKDQIKTLISTFKMQSGLLIVYTLP
jgi:hypothetical protein